MLIFCWTLCASSLARAKNIVSAHFGTAVNPSSWTLASRLASWWWTSRWSQTGSGCWTPCTGQWCHQQQLEKIIMLTAFSVLIRHWYMCFKEKYLWSQQCYTAHPWCTVWCPAAWSRHAAQQSLRCSHPAEKIIIKDFWSINHTGKETLAQQWPYHDV